MTIEVSYRYQWRIQGGPWVTPSEVRPISFSIWCAYDIINTHTLIQSHTRTSQLLNNGSTYIGAHFALEEVFTISDRIAIRCIYVRTLRHIFISANITTDDRTTRASNMICLSIIGK